MLDRRAILLGVLSLGFAAPARAGLVGEYRITVKNENNMARLDVRLTLGWAGIQINNKPLFSLTVPTGGKFVGRNVSLPGGNLEFRARKSGTKIQVNSKLTALGGLQLFKSWHIVDVDGSRTLKIYN